MKTILIQLERHDDLISIRDRMAWAKAPRVLLIWPRRGRVGIRPLDLVLLRRHAAGQGARLGLVTHNQQMRAAARELNIPCFHSTKEAQKEDWPVDTPSRPVRRFPRLDLRAARQRLLPADPFDVQSDAVARVSVFALGVLALLAIMLVFVPSAQIHIAFPEKPQRVAISVSAAPDFKTVQLSGAVPVQTISQIFEINGGALSTGQLTQPDKFALGSALFTNLTQQPVKIPAGTVVLTRGEPPVPFVTLTDAEVPAGKKAALLIDLRAVTAGSAGNVPAGAISAFEGPLGLTMQVTNPEPLAGGTDVLAATPTTQDHNSLRARLLNDLERQARAEFARQVAEGNVLLPSTFKLINILNENSFPAPGQAGAKLALTLKVEYSIAYVLASDLEKLSSLVMDASLPEGSVPVPGTLT